MPTATEEHGAWLSALVRKYTQRPFLIKEQATEHEGTWLCVTIRGCEFGPRVAPERLVLRDDEHVIRQLELFLPKGEFVEPRAN